MLVDLGCEVTDAAPDLSGADETFRAWRAFRFATAYAPLLREHRDQLGPNVVWNIERGLELTTGELSRATALRAESAGRAGEFFATAEVLACPVSQVPPFDVTIDWVHEIDGVPQRTYLDWMASCYLISATGLPAISVLAGSPPMGYRWGSSCLAGGGGMVAAGCGARLRGRHRPRQARPHAAAPVDPAGGSLRSWRVAATPAGG